MVDGVTTTAVNCLVRKEKKGAFSERGYVVHVSAFEHEANPVT